LGFRRLIVGVENVNVLENAMRNTASRFDMTWSIHYPAKCVPPAAQGTQPPALCAAPGARLGAPPQLRRCARHTALRSRVCQCGVRCAAPRLAHGAARAAVHAARRAASRAPSGCSRVSLLIPFAELVTLSARRLKRMAVLVSKSDHCLYDLLIRHQSGELPCDIPIIISNHADLEPVAKQFSIPFKHLPMEAGVDKEARYTACVRCERALSSAHRLPRLRRRRLWSRCLLSTASTSSSWRATCR
jgi:hypothetical protein